MLPLVSTRQREEQWFSAKHNPSAESLEAMQRALLVDVKKRNKACETKDGTDYCTHDVPMVEDFLERYPALFEGTELRLNKSQTESFILVLLLIKKESWVNCEVPDCTFVLHLLRYLDFPAACQMVAYQSLCEHSFIFRLRVNSSECPPSHFKPPSCLSWTSTPPTTCCGWTQRRRGRLWLKTQCTHRKKTTEECAQYLLLLLFFLCLISIKRKTNHRKQ